MSTRQTSIDVYNQIKEEGLLPSARFKVYEYIFLNGGCTGTEVNKGLGSASAHKRLSELREMGCVYENGERECRITGRNAIVWETTFNLPNGIPPAKKSERKCKTCAENERTIWVLRQAFKDLRKTDPVAAKVFAESIKKRS